MQSSPGRITDLTPYAGNWIACIGEQIVGVGSTPDAAKQLARRNRLKERFTLQFVEKLGGDSLRLPPLMDVLRPLLQNHPQPIYLVGGSVRDALLGRECHDLDFVVPRGAVKLAFQIGNALGLPTYVLDEKRDTGRVMHAETGMTLDFARFRGSDLMADLQDRDFTINALAIPAAAKTRASVIDVTGGLADLENRQLCLVREDAIQRDGARALRAIRMKHSLGFELAPETETAVSSSITALRSVSAERLRDELLKILETDSPQLAMQKMQELGLLQAVLPEIAALNGIQQSAPHQYPVWEHTLQTLAWLVQIEAVADSQLANLKQILERYSQQIEAHLNRPISGDINGRILLRLGALFHDVGKPLTQTVEDGRIRFLGHEGVGAEIAAKRLQQLCMSSEAIKYVKQIVAHHMRPLHLVSSTKGVISRRAIFRFFRATGTAGLDVILLALADHLGTYAGTGPQEKWERLLQVTTSLLRAYFEQREEVVAPPVLVNGRDLMQTLNIPPGPEVGRLLRLIQEAQAVGEIKTSDEAIQFAHRIHA